MIQISNLKKVYGNKVALDIEHLTLENTGIVGFLGHNGAGKTTFLNILSSLIPASEGEVKLNGRDVFNQSEQMKQICFIAETSNFYPDLKIKDVLYINKLFYENWNEAYANELLSQFKLEKKLKVKNLSKGMLSALGIITGLASGTPIVIFDEPYIGLDAAARQLFYELLLENYTENPRLIIMSTHLIDEAAELFNEVIILHDGKVLMQDRYTNIQQKLVKVKGKKDTLTPFLKDKKVLQQSSFLSETSAIIEVDSHVQIPSNLSVESVKLQEVMVALSKQYREV